MTESLPLWERGLKCKRNVPSSGVYLVAPLVGAWIEIFVFPPVIIPASSLPLWERGLKSHQRAQNSLGMRVAPLVGAWIEIVNPTGKLFADEVAPLVGAWIEIPRIG